MTSPLRASNNPLALRSRASRLTLALLAGALSGGVIVALGPVPAPSGPAVAAPPHGSSAIASANDAGADARATPCPAGLIPEHDLCVPVPDPLEVGDETAHIALLVGLPSDYTSYQTPLPGRPGMADAAGRGLFVPAPAGSAAISPTVRGQVGEPSPRVLSNGTVIVLHRVSAGAVEHTYILVYRGLEASPDARASTRRLGNVAVGARGLHLTARKLRQGVDPASVGPDQLVTDAYSVSCDPRNLLPLDSP